MIRKGSVRWALDYREFVRVIKVEIPQSGERAGRYTVQRPSGARTFNFPGYLLRASK
jgi:hypothetical protein